jgi:uncharacterized protein (TIGR04255 family)
LCYVSSLRERQKSAASAVGGRLTPLATLQPARHAADDGSRLPLPSSSRRRISLRDPFATHSELELVTFDSPPLSEVGLSLQFAKPDLVDLDVLAAFTAATREALPRRQHQPAIPAMIETFDDVPRQMQFSIQIQGQLTLPRAWFLSEDEITLVQLQPDRLSFNWRRLGGVEYPRYPEIHDGLMQYFTILKQCVEAMGGDAPVVNLCEVVYINPIRLPDSPANAHPDLSRILRRVRSEASDFLPAPEDGQLQERFRIEGETGPIGRLYLTATPSVAGEPPQPVYMLNLSARVLPSDSGPEAVSRALNVGHAWVVKGFKDATTDEAHKLWGLRKEES